MKTSHNIPRSRGIKVTKLMTTSFKSSFYLIKTTTNLINLIYANPVIFGARFLGKGVLGP